jgi:hypothetical protein
MTANRIHPARIVPSVGGAFQQFRPVKRAMIQAACSPAWHSVSMREEHHRVSVPLAVIVGRSRDTIARLGHCPLRLNILTEAGEELAADQVAREHGEQHEGEVACFGRASCYHTAQVGA